MMETIPAADDEQSTQPVAVGHTTPLGSATILVGW